MNAGIPLNLIQAGRHFLQVLDEYLVNLGTGGIQEAPVIEAEIVSGQSEPEKTPKAVSLEELRSMLSDILAVTPPDQKDETKKYLRELKASVCGGENKDLKAMTTDEIQAFVKSILTDPKFE